MSYPDFLLDKRVLQRNLKKGLVDAKEYEKLVARLPDVANNADACSPERSERSADDESE
jgi:hypothetical protein